MNIFERILGILGKREESIADSGDCVEVVRRFAEDLRKHYGESGLASDAQTTQVLALYCFGGISALAMQKRIKPSEAHAICIAVYTKVFGFAAQDAAAKAQAVITAASDSTSHLYGIIHRGADAFMHWQSRRVDVAAKDLKEIMSVCCLRNTDY